MSLKKRRARHRRKQKNSLSAASSATPVERSPPEEQLPSLHGPQLEDNELQVALHVRGEKFVGPIPRAEHLAKYEEVRPGTADWIIGRAEKQHDHQIDMEKRSVDAAIATEKRGQWLSSVLLLALLGVVAFGIIPAAERLLTHVFYGLLASFAIGNLPRWIAAWRTLFKKQDESDSLPPPSTDD